jgi:hypothetical protein
MSGLLTVAVAVIAACAAAAPSPARSQEQPKITDWKPMAVSGLEYACDPVLGVIVRHKGYQLGGGDGDAYPNITLSVVPYSQLNIGQRQQMCEINR